MSQSDHATPQRLEAMVPNPAGATRVANDLIALAERFGYGKASRFAIRLAFEEAISNAFKHGHREAPADTPVRVEAIVGHEEVTVVIEDQGPGFDPQAIPDPTLDENLDKPFGRGLMLINAYMSRVSHDNRGRRIEMVYLKPPTN